MAACKLYTHKTAKLALLAYEVESSRQTDECYSVLNTQNIIPDAGCL